MNKLHKASSGDPLYILNIFLGVALLFFVISSFWMYVPKTEIFKRGIYLFAQLSGQSEFEIFPKSKTEFVWKALDAGVTFVSEDGKEYAIHSQHVNTIKAPKIKTSKFNTSELKKIEGASD